jgi:hypothetical protein
VQRDEKLVLRAGSDRVPFVTVPTLPSPPSRLPWGVTPQIQLAPGAYGWCSFSKKHQLRELMSSDFALTVYRQYPSAGCTSGYLAVNDQIVCYTLERPWADNQQNISSIPAGTYDGALRYDHSDHWRIELQNVPGRTNVQIHVGNQPDESKGCILVGRKLGPTLCTLQDSALAYADLKSRFYGTDSPTETPDKQITVAVVDAGRVG